MPTVDERLKQVTLKIKRAKEHIAELDGKLRAFIDSNPYVVGTKHDPQTRKLVYYITSVEPTPECLPLIAGDVIQNLMSALDHLAFQLVCSDTEDTPPNPNWIYFPIQDDATKYESKKLQKIEGASQGTVDAIDALKPYKGGNDLLWMLYRLNNIEKHRVLFTVGSQAAGVSLRHMAASFSVGSFQAEALALIEGVMESLFLIPADKGFPLKEGFELLIGAVDEKPDPKQQFRFQVALNEPGLLRVSRFLKRSINSRHL